jgi:hypothetical protein
MGETVPLHAMLMFEMADEGFDGGATPHFAFDLRGEATLLL